MTTITTHRTGIRRCSRGGFTLLEMILVISVILFLLAFLVAMAGMAHMDAQQQASMSLVHTIETALQNYYGQHGEYPPGGRQSLFIHLTEEKYGRCMEQIPQGALAYEPFGADKGKPFFVDAWGSSINVVAFDASGLQPNPTGGALEYQHIWGVNGGVPLVWSIGPDRKGWSERTIRGVRRSRDFVNLMYLKTDGDDNEDNLSNFRDIPLEYVK